jgi:hypothetical protein
MNRGPKNAFTNCKAALSFVRLGVRMAAHACVGRDFTKSLCGWQLACKWQLLETKVVGDQPEWSQIAVLELSAVANEGWKLTGARS